MLLDQQIYFLQSSVLMLMSLHACCMLPDGDLPLLLPAVLLGLLTCQ